MRRGGGKTQELLRIRAVYVLSVYKNLSRRVSHVLGRVNYDFGTDS